MLTLYGIPNCDTVKQARTRLESEGVAYRFHNFRKDGVDAHMLSDMLAALGSDKLLNKRGTTWRKLTPPQQASALEDGGLALMLAEPAIIKRPVWERDGEYRLGFQANEEDAIVAWAKA